MNGTHNPYAIDKLMEETRKIAHAYYQNTGKTLPISNELGRFDAQKILELQSLTHPEMGVDFLGTGRFASQKFVIKSRVIFKPQKSGHRMGALSLDGNWDSAILVVYNAEYKPDEIYMTKKDDIIQAIGHISHNQRNGFSIAKFKALGTLVWDSTNGHYRFDI